MLFLKFPLYQTFGHDSTVIILKTGKERERCHHATELRGGYFIRRREWEVGKRREERSRRKEEVGGACGLKGA